jgi:hypothetical protein
MQVLQKKAGKWLIASFQNTNAVPESLIYVFGGTDVPSLQ